MNKIGKLTLILVVIFALGMMMSCGGGSSDDGGGGLVVTTPTTATQGTQAASGATQGATLGGGSAETFSNLGGIGLGSVMDGDEGASSMKIPGAHTGDAGLSKSAKLSARLARSRTITRTVAAFRKAKAMRAQANGDWNYSHNCDHSGTISATGTFSGDDDPANTQLHLVLNITAVNCKEDGVNIDGPMLISADLAMTSSDTSTTVEFSIVQALGTDADKLTVIEYSDTDYSVEAAELKADITLSMTGTGNEGEGGDTTFGTITMNATGKIDVHDILNQVTYALSYSNFRFTVTGTTAMDGMETWELLVNGGFSESWNDQSQTPNIAKSVSVGFEQFKLTAVHANATTSESDESISGGFSIDFSPDTCFEGGYSFETITPVHHNASGMTTAGEIRINGVVIVKYNADGTITVTMSGEEIHNGDSSSLSLVCEFETLDD